MLEIKRLKHKYRFSSQSFSDLSFSVKKGEILCLFGKEESGKTSVLKAICGLLPVSDGKIILNGKDITFLSPKERNMTLLHEDGGFFEHKTVRYNLEYPLRIRGVDRSEIDLTVKSVADKMKIASILDTKINKISKQERIAVSFARLFLRTPDVYLLDDPFKSLDNREETFDKYKKYLQELCELAPVVYATSDSREMVELNSSNCILNYGILQQNGTITELKEQSMTVFIYELFHSESAKTTGKLRLSDTNEVILSFDNTEYVLQRDKLLNDIYLGKDVLVYSQKGKDCKVFDKNCERMIYFAEIN